MLRASMGLGAISGSSNSSRSNGSPSVFCAVTPATVPTISLVRRCRRSRIVFRLASSQRLRNDLAFEFAAEQRADPRAGKAKRITGAAVERDDESLAENLPDGGWFDLGALRGGAPSAKLLPICVKLTTCRVFHKTPAPAFAAEPEAVPHRDRFWPFGVFAGQ